MVNLANHYCAINFMYICSEFHDIFDVDYFINSLKDEVHILKELPPPLKKEVDSGKLFSMPPVSWSNMTYYYEVVST